MSSYHNGEDVWFSACTSLGLHGGADEARAKLPPHRPDEVRRALDRLYRRRRLAPARALHNGHHTNVWVRRHLTDHVEDPLRGSDLVDDGVAALVVSYPHV